MDDDKSPVKNPLCGFQHYTNEEAKNDHITEHNIGVGNLLWEVEQRGRSPPRQPRSSAQYDNSQLCAFLLRVLDHVKPQPCAKTLIKPVFVKLTNEEFDSVEAFFKFCHEQFSERKRSLASNFLCELGLRQPPRRVNTNDPEALFNYIRDQLGALCPDILAEIASNPKAKDQMEALVTTLALRLLSSYLRPAAINFLETPSNTITTTVTTTTIDEHGDESVTTYARVQVREMLRNLGAHIESLKRQPNGPRTRGNGYRNRYRTHRDDTNYSNNGNTRASQHEVNRRNSSGKDHYEQRSQRPASASTNGKRPFKQKDRVNNVANDKARRSGHQQL